jgi:hypothetical protein
MIIIPYLFLQFIFIRYLEKRTLFASIEKREDDGFTVYIYHSKTNQRGVFGKANKVLIPYNEEIISYDKYISLHLKNADPEFYLEMGNEDGWYYCSIFF